MLSKAFDACETNIRKPDISMTPLIDMVFILLIFFVVTTTFTKETGIKVDKAKAATTQIINKNLLLVAIDKSGSYWHDKKKYPLPSLVSLILEQNELNPALNIVIIPDKNGRVEPLITLMDNLRGHKITRFSLGTQRKDLL